MNKIDDILDRLQHQPLPTVDNPNELTDSIMDSLPDRHCDTPSSTDGRQRRRVWLYVASTLSAAACIALLMVLHFGGETDGGVVAEGHSPVRHVIPAAESVTATDTVKVAKAMRKPDAAEKVRQPVVQPKASFMEHQPATQPAAQPTAAATETTLMAAETPLMAAETPLMAAETTAADTDSMTIMVARMESEMQRISDECYMNHLSRVIDNNPQLKRLVDDFISETGKGASTAVCVKEM